jgi:23S rRNA pseudouridine2457 synthase
MSAGELARRNQLTGGGTVRTDRDGTQAVIGDDIMPLHEFATRPESLYIAFFKPYGVLSQFGLPDGSEHRSLAEFGFPPAVYPVGRLDWDSEGLLLLSDDGRLNKTLLDPAGKHRRLYLAQVENVPTLAALEQLATGVLIDGRLTHPARARVLATQPHLPPRPVPIRYRKAIPTAWLELVLTEGRNRQVRRMTAAVGHPTLRLVRAAIGNLTIEGLALQPGEWLKLSAAQVEETLAR